MQTSRRVIFFANARSGRSRRWFFQIIEEAERLGFRFHSVHFDLETQAVKEALDRAEEAGISTVLAAGGDGTIGCIAGHVYQRDFCLGVIPAGTSNDFARSLDVPMSVRGALQVVVNGRVARVDLGQAGDRAFVHSAILGLNTQFAVIAGRLRRYIGRASYPLAALAAYMHRTPVKGALITEQGELAFDALEVAVLNAPIVAGALELRLAEADLTDHRLRVVIVEDANISRVLRALPHALRKKVLKLPGIEQYPIRECCLVTERPAQVTLDGELGPTTPVSVRVLPGALKVFVPPGFGKHE